MTQAGVWSRRRFLGTAAGGAGLVWLHPRQAWSAAGLSVGVTRSINDADALHAAGFDYIEGSVGPILVPDKTDADFEPILARLRALPIPVPVCCNFLPGAMKIVGPGADHDAAATYALTALRRAGMAGIGIIVFGSGGARRIPDGFDPAKAREQFIAFGKRIAPGAQRAGVRLALEPLNRKETNFINSLGEGAEIVDSVGHPAFCLHADVYHMLQEDEAPEAILAAGARIIHAHVAQKGTRLAPLPGGTDVRPYFAALKRIGYGGKMSIESNWPEGEPAFARACAYVREQWAAA